MFQQLLAVRMAHVTSIFLPIFHTHHDASRVHFRRKKRQFQVALSSRLDIYSWADMTPRGRRITRSTAYFQHASNTALRSFTDDVFSGSGRTYTVILLQNEWFSISGSIIRDSQQNHVPTEPQNCKLCPTIIQEPAKNIIDFFVQDIDRAPRWSSLKWEKERGQRNSRGERKKAIISPNQACGEQDLQGILQRTRKWCF